VARSPGVLLGALAALNGLNYLDRYVAAATLPLILASLAITDAQGGALQSLFVKDLRIAGQPRSHEAAVHDILQRVHLRIFQQFDYVVTDANAARRMNSGKW
jgi:hypothetical protein